MCCPDRAYGVRAMKTNASALVALSVLAGIAGSANALDARTFCEKHHEKVVQPVSFTIPAAPDQEESAVTNAVPTPIRRAGRAGLSGWAVATTTRVSWKCGTSGSGGCA